MTCLYMNYLISNLETESKTPNIYHKITDLDEAQVGIRGSQRQSMWVALNWEPWAPSGRLGTRVLAGASKHTSETLALAGQLSLSRHRVGKLSQDIKAHSPAFRLSLRFPKKSQVGSFCGDRAEVGHSPPADKMGKGTDE